MRDICRGSPAGNVYVILIVQRLWYSAGYKEIRDYIIPLREFIAQAEITLLGDVSILTEEKIEIPLDNISGVGELLGNRFPTDLVTLLIVFGVSYIIYLLFLLFRFPYMGKGIPTEKMIDSLSILLLLVQSLRKCLFSYKFVDYCLKDDIEILGEQKLVHARMNPDIFRLLEECVT